MDGLALALGFALSAATGAAIGALLAGPAALRLVERLWPAVLARVKVVVTIDDVDVRAHLEQPEPVVLEVLTAPVASNQELAERVFAEFPDVGPRALARILRVSPATASALIADHELAPGARSHAVPLTGTKGV